MSGRRGAAGADRYEGIVYPPANLGHASWNNLTKGA